MARASAAPSVTAVRRLSRAARLCLCALVLLLLVVQQWGQQHALGHGLGHVASQANVEDSARDGTGTPAPDSAPDHRALSHPGAELCDLCLVLAVFTAAFAFPGLLHWCSACLGLASPRGPPSAAVPLLGGWAVQARGPPLDLALIA